MRFRPLIFNNQGVLSALLLDNAPLLLPVFGPHPNLVAPTDTRTDTRSPSYDRIRSRAQQRADKREGTRPMYRKFIATIAAAAVAITAFGARPAAADEKEVLRTLAAIAGVAIVGKMIYDNNKERNERETVTRRRAAPVYEAPRYYPTVSKRPHPRPYIDPRPEPHRSARTYPERDRATYPEREVRPLPERVDRKLLPQQCFRSYDGEDGKVMMFGEPCLEKNYSQVDRLPNYCAKRVKTADGARYGYDARCLRDSGYSLARR